MKIEYAGATDIGCRREHNEDAFVVQPIGADEHYVLATAIDGCGGYAGGDEAAWIAQKTITELVLAANINEYGTDLLKQVITQANNNIIHAQCNPYLQNMCCVATTVLVDREQKKLYMAHVGDTRLYEYHNLTNIFVKHTHDHSLIGPKEENGELTEHEAMLHPRRNIITKALGLMPLTWFDNYIELAEFPLTPNTQWLLCSDGLYDMIDSAEIKAVLSTSRPIKDKTTELIERAKVACGKDNITVVLLSIVND